ncbi:LPS export ABC transporter periplasmic protein LptC [Algihabitans albus]|uniref:LPS export ABC transporter periplasmic protein LptC n=1 Tax=Algihabitans albus TaxID=2164067 RepID=UPI0013C2B99D|nr:LPS export ABC transporter periplasmic protein LptC [Algihabitans albus]
MAQSSSEQAGSKPVEGRSRRRRVAPPRLSGRSAYSIFVNAMKLLLPTVAVGLVLLIAIWPQIERTGGFRLDAIETFGDTPVPEEATMINPRYEGIDENRRPFMITADVARQLDPGEEETIDMRQPAADLFDDVGKWLAITADHGVYERGQEVLLLDGNVNIFHDDGYELQTDQAVVDLAADLATSSMPTFGQGSFGTITSEGLRVEERGARVFFTGRAHMVLYPSDQDPEAGTDTGTNPAPQDSTP